MLDCRLLQQAESYNRQSPTCSLRTYLHSLVVYYYLTKNISEKFVSFYRICVLISQNLQIHENCVNALC